MSAVEALAGDQSRPGSRADARAAVRDEVIAAMSWAESFTGGRIGIEGAERLLSEYEAELLAPQTIDRDALVQPAAEREWCVQYRCPGMDAWVQWVDSGRHFRQWAEVVLAECREHETDPGVEYRLATRTCTAWEAAS